VEYARRVPRLREIVLLGVCLLQPACNAGAHTDPARGGPDPPDAAASSAGSASAAASAPPPPATAAPGGDAEPGDEGTYVAAPLPEAALGPVLGCWEMTSGQERWHVARAAGGGATVVRTLLGTAAPPGDTDYVRRAALPSELWYNARARRFGLTTAGPIHGLVFIFTASAEALEGSWYREKPRPLEWTGNTATLRRCAGKPQ
jgi:hypothetical protein